MMDEEALARPLTGADQRSLGAFFTPAPLVEEVLQTVSRWLPATGPRSVIDPACGAGAFLHAARAHFPRASFYGIELHPAAAEACEARVPDATILRGDALRGGFEGLAALLPNDGFELWIGNPPYNGTSATLQDPEVYRRLRSLLPERLPKGQSLRDDYAFFLLLAAERLSGRDGALAFVTSASLLDAYLYAPVRARLMEQLVLREVIELGGSVFRGARVRTAVTIWTGRGVRAPVRYRKRREDAIGFSSDQLESASTFVPEAPEFLLRPPPVEASALDRAWRAQGEALTTLIPVSSPGLKTRFDELLVDDDPERLLERVRAFVECPAEELQGFAESFGLSLSLLPKLEALKAFATLNAAEVSTACVRPFFRYAGARHRGRIPESARAFCYLDRRLIPRGDHRLRGSWDPHACDVKLVFNVRELPLAAAFVDQPGCIHDHRHARFAPLHVPQRIRDEGLEITRSTSDLGPDVPNLSPRGLAWAERLGGPHALYEALVRFINSRPVQDVWAPAFGASRELHVTLEALTQT